LITVMAKTKIVATLLDNIRSQSAPNHAYGSNNTS
jgi:hypothetical protein